MEFSYLHHCTCSLRHLLKHYTMHHLAGFFSSRLTESRLPRDFEVSLVITAHNYDVDLIPDLYHIRDSLDLVEQTARGGTGEGTYTLGLAGRSEAVQDEASIT